MKKPLLFLFLSLQIFTTKAQLSMEWQRRHCPNGTSCLWVLGMTTDKKGNTYVIEQADKIIKYNSSGIELWEKDYPFLGSCTNTTVDWWNSIQVDDKENIYFVDQRTNAGFFYMVKLDSNGNYIYQNKIANFYANNYYYFFIDKNDFVNLIIQDHGVIPNDSMGTVNYFLSFFRMDTAGNTLINFAFQDSSFIMQLLEDSVGSIYLATNEIYTYDTSYNYIRKFDEAGHLIWTHRDEPNSFFPNINWSPDGYLIESYESGMNKINMTTGDTLKHLNIPGLNSIYEKSDNFGNTYFEIFDSTSFKIAKYDNDLNLKYQYAPQGYGLNGYENLRLGRDKNIFLVGSKDYGSFVPEYVYVDELDSLGNLVNSNLLTNPSVTVYQFKSDVDTSGSLYICLRLENHSDIDLIKYCSTCSPNVSGNVFFDSNINCISDSGEKRLSNRLVELLPEQAYVVTDSSGNYSFQTGKGLHTIHEVLPNAYWKFSCDSVYNISLDSINAIALEQNFGNTITEGINDLSVSIGYSHMRPGFSSWVTINYANNGTMDLNPTITLKLDTLFSFLSFPDSLMYASKDSLAWKIGILQSGTSGQINLLVHVSALAQIGTLFQLTARISPLVDDINPADNISSIPETIRGSYDPNEKIVYPLSVRNSGVITPSSSVSYQVNFQNTGNDTAFTVVVQDRIDPNLNLSTFKMESASNPYQLSIINGRTLQWTFNNIFLSDKNHNEPGSHGFLRYSISTKPNIPSSDLIINNSASIYFDYNQPVNTDTVSLIERGKVFLPFTVNSLIAYPNPASSESIIAFKLAQTVSAQLQMFDLLGRQVTNWNLGTLSEGTQYYPINTLQQYPSGLYFIRLVSADGNQVCKLVLER